jgi:hypothetical protein
MIMMDVEGESELEVETLDLKGACRACTEKTKQNIGSFQGAAEDAALKRMSEALETTSIASRYCCGGGLVEEAPRVGICFGHPISDKIWRANLPMETEHTKRGHTDMVKRLYQACDDNGRIEAAPEGSLFTSFDPNGGAGIIYMITQIMLPGIVGGGVEIRGREQLLCLHATLSHLYVGLSFLFSQVKVCNANHQ